MTRLTLSAGGAHALLMALAFPPFNLWPLSLAALLPLVWLSGRLRRPGAGAALGLLAAAQAPLWAFEQRWLIEVTPVGYPLMVLGMSAFAPLFVWALAAARRLAWLPLGVSAALLWVGLEFLRGQVLFYGYPWYLVGQPLIEWPLLASPAAIASVYLVSLLAAALGGFAFDLAEGRRGAGAIGLGAVAAIWGGAIAWHAARELEGQSVLRLALIQTNVPQDNKNRWTEQQRAEDFIAAMEMSIAAARAEPAPDLIAWPETMYPGYFLEPATVAAVLDAGEEDASLQPFGQVVQDFSNTLLQVQAELGIPMLIGVRGFDGLYLRDGEDGQKYWDARAIYNSALLVEGGRVRPGRYDKLHLTPFGEVMPYVHQWPWLERRLLALGARGMEFELSAGAAPHRLESGAATLATPICFEATMPAVCRGLVFENGRRQAVLLVNLTNDGWFGSVDAGRAQHLQAARWRAVELATPLVRAANTGISCAIDARGRMVASLPPREAGVLLVELSPGTATTPYAHVREAVGWLSLAGAGLLLVASGATSRKERTPRPNPGANEEETA